jgi:calcineurin-like phosphoesterase family protein
MDGRSGVRNCAALASFLVAVLLASMSVQTPVAAAASSALKRYPYLTDVVNGSATLNWATDRSSINGRLTWGPAGSCGANSVAATRTAITVNGVSEYQWTAKATGLAPQSSYCYRVYLGSSAQTDLLGTDPSPVLTTLPASGAGGSSTFAVIGDWGQAFANGNPDQDALLTQLAASPAQFAVFTGDTGYPAGTQANYGDLVQTGSGISGVFAPNFWAKVGRSMPTFAAVGNHAPNSTFLSNWPESTVAAASGGRWAMEDYASVNGSTAKSYPSAWYAFDAGPARFYVLDATWDDNNLGTGTPYANDYAAHWTPSSPEYQWLAADLAAHPGGTKFAFWHYPLYSDQSTEKPDTFLQGADSLEGLLARNGVDIAFNGHAHVYQRNLKPHRDSLVSYITGGGGAALQSMGGAGCTAVNAYGIGWRSSSGGPASACGAAPLPQGPADVYHFLLVTVAGSQVTVQGVKEDGSTFDSTTYDFSSDGAGAPTSPGSPTATYDGTKATLSWSASTDDIGVNAYEVARDGAVIATLPWYTTSYADPAAPKGTTVQYTVTALDGNGLRSAAAAAPPLQTGAQTTTVTVGPSDDAYVQVDKPTTNFGSSTNVYAVAGTAVKRSYLRFPLDALSGCSLVSAKLGLYVTDQASKGGTFAPVPDHTWTEKTLTWQNAPTVPTSPTVTLGAAALNTRVTVDVTSLVQAGDATLDLAISSASTDRVGYSSKEAGSAQAPQLALQCTPGS